MLLLLPRRNLQQLFSQHPERQKWQKNSILTDGEIAAVWFLPQAHPTSETIYVDYDDV
jgi:hypothetical protein